MASKPQTGVPSKRKQAHASGLFRPVRLGSERKGLFLTFNCRFLFRTTGGIARFVAQTEQISKGKVQLLCFQLKGTGVNDWFKCLALYLYLSGRNVADVARSIRTWDQSPDGRGQGPSVAGLLQVSSNNYYRHEQQLVRHQERCCL